MEKASRGLILVVLLLTALRQCHCQCYQSLDCVGSTTNESTLRGCCRDTDDGLSWRSGDGHCVNCIDVACTQLGKNSLCKKDDDSGGTRLQARDVDDMFIGFPERRSFVRENMFPSDSSFPAFLTIHSLRVSEFDYDVLFSVTGSTANVSHFRDLTEGTDASFGSILVSNLSSAEYVLSAGAAVLTEVPIIVTNDFLIEDNETITMSVSPSTSGNITRTFECYDDGEDPVRGNYFCSHTVIIVDEDEPLVVSFEHTMYEVVESAGDVSVCVVLTRPDTDIFENRVAVEVFEDNVTKTNEYFPDGAAIANAGADYERQELGNSTIRNERITELRRRVCYDQVIHDDTLLEPTEYFGLTLKVQDHKSMGGPTTVETVVGIGHAVIRILDDDDPVFSFEQTSYTMAEAEFNTAYFIEILTRVYFGSTVSIQLQEVAGGTADANDYSVPTDVFLYHPGSDSILVPITITADDKVELTEELLIRMTQASSVSFSTEQSVISIFIEDDDGEFLLRFEETKYAVNEGSNTSVCFIIENSPPPELGFEFQFNVTVMSSDGSAQAEEDYVAINTTLLGSTVERQCVTVQTLDDMIVEDKETLIISAKLDDNLPVSFSNTAEVSITDSDVFVLQFEEATYVVNEGESISVCFIVENPPPLEEGFQFHFDVTVISTDESAQAGEDYVAANITLLGSTIQRQCVRLQTLDDMIVEDDETLLIFAEVDETLPVSLNSTAVVRINDDEVVILGFRDISYQVTEGENVEICLTDITAKLEKDILITVESTGVTAQSGEDFTAVSRQFTFGPGSSTPACVTVAAATDGTYEDSETLTLTITSTDRSMALNPNTAIITIKENINLATIIAIPIVITVLLAAVIIIIIIIGIVCFKKRKARGKQEIEMPFYAATKKPLDSKETSTSPSPEHQEPKRESSERPPLVTPEQSMVREARLVSDPDTMLYEEVVGDGEYEAVDPPVLQPASQAARAPGVMKVNVAYGVVEHQI